MRPPSPPSESRSRPSFLRTTPARKPRTECCCHPVARIIASIVAPAGPHSIAISRACLVSERSLLLEVVGVEAAGRGSFVRRDVGLRAVDRAVLGCFDLG